MAEINLGGLWGMHYLVLVGLNEPTTHIFKIYINSLRAVFRCITVLLSPGCCHLPSRGVDSDEHRGASAQCGLEPVRCT